jgi:hypothetical protein
MRQFFAFRVVLPPCDSERVCFPLSIRDRFRQHGDVNTSLICAWAIGNNLDEARVHLERISCVAFQSISLCDIEQ